MDSATFYTTFQSLKNDVQTALTTSPSTAAGALQTLRQYLADHRASLPAYDQRSSDQQLRDLELQLAAKRPPKSKFSFKKSTTTTPESSTPSTSIPTPARSPHPTQPQPTAPVPTPPTTYTLSNNSNTHLSAPPATQPYTLTLSNLHNCTIDLRNSPLTALHVHDLSDCVVYASIDGSAMLSELKRCVLVLEARQFRLHSSSGVVVLLEVGSLPVIERCEGVMFGPYTAGESGSGLYAQVQDFDWVRGGQSPHWRLLEGQEGEVVRSALTAASASEVLSRVPFLYTN